MDRPGATSVLARDARIFPRERNAAVLRGPRNLVQGTRVCLRRPGARERARRPSSLGVVVLYDVWVGHATNPLRPWRRHVSRDDLESRLVRGLMLAPASANIVMQLSRLQVGRGVAESSVEGGSLTRHPIKRTRTTLAYVWVSLYGSDAERAELRRNVDAQHRHVRSRPGGDVVYDAFDPDLQLWVAACMYVGSLQGYETLYGEATNDVADDLLAQCSRFATTLQVPAHKWPGDRAAFAAYWTSSLAQVRVDEVTSRYLRDFVDLRFLPRPLGFLLRPINRLLTAGYLAAPFRDALGMPWGDVQQRRFARVTEVLRRVNRILPLPVARLPWNLVRYDTRRRLARQRPLV